jgi:hypothetical protein
MASAILAIERAIREARKAYQFNPSSYTYWTYAECLTAMAVLIEPSWIDLYLDYALEVPEQDEPSAAA